MSNLKGGRERRGEGGRGGSSKRGTRVEICINALNVHRIAEPEHTLNTNLSFTDV